MYILKVLILLLISCSLLFIVINSLKNGKMNNAITGKGWIFKGKNPLQYWFRIILTLIFAILSIYQIFILN